MRPNTVLLAPLALYASGALAFYPYTPPWLKELEEHNAGEAKRSVENGMTFDVRRRASRRVSPSRNLIRRLYMLTHDSLGSCIARRKGCMASGLASSQIQRTERPEFQP